MTPRFPSLLRPAASLAAAALVLVSTARSARADEGMWLYNAPPRDLIKQKYDFELTDRWLQHLMKSSVRFNSGGSGSFISSDGLVITNHHVGADDLQKLSDEKHNYLHDGFYAATPADEKKCVDLELNVLQSIEDVTQRVNAAVPTGATGEAASLARRKVFAEIEKESREATGLRSDVVTLYQGGAYHLYRYKRYTDVRLVFAPEQQAAFYGGDPDNFEYPRYDLDVCFFRVYENGAPAKIENHLSWSTGGLKENDLVFVSGHPGRTERGFTNAELHFTRDTQFPYAVDRLKRLEVLLKTWGDRSAENARRARDDFFGIQNSRKAYDGMQAGLYSPGIMGVKEANERQFRQLLADQPNSAAVVAAFDKIATAQLDMAKIYRRYRLLEGGNGFYSDSFTLARNLLRAGDERPKPNGERLKEFADARRESFELELFSDKPIYPDLETLKLGDALTFLAEQLGFDDPVVQKVLAGESPRDRAVTLIQKTQVRDVEFRKRLYKDGAAEVTKATDPMIELARAIDTEARALRKQWEADDEIKQQAHALIERAHFAAEGPTRAPDATFTLRLSYGTVKGYEEAGKHVAPFTTIAGLYDRSAQHGNREPFELPERWVQKKSALDLATPFNFVTDCDIVGGNSGSPTVDRDGRFVGIIFDGNIESLVLDFAFDGNVARAVSVDSRAILEALTKVYGHEALVNEIRNGHK